jgi:hypothetical protein
LGFPSKPPNDQAECHSAAKHFEFVGKARTICALVANLSSTCLVVVTQEIFIERILHWRNSHAEEEPRGEHPKERLDKRTKSDNGGSCPFLKASLVGEVLVLPARIEVWICEPHWIEGASHQVCQVEWDLWAPKQPKPENGVHEEDEGAQHGIESDNRDREVTRE